MPSMPSAPSYAERSHLRESACLPAQPAQGAPATTAYQTACALQDSLCNDTLSHMLLFLCALTSQRVKGVFTAGEGHHLRCSVSIPGATIPHTPAARGIQAGVRVQQDALTDLLSAALPWGMRQPEMQFTGAQEEIDGVKLSFQVC